MKTFYLPDLGEGLAEAEIHEWHVKEGDEVMIDQPLVSMETAKAIVEVPSPHTGKISKLCGRRGDIIPTHGPLLEFEGEELSPRKDQGTVVGNLEESSMILEDTGMIIGAAKTDSSTIKAMPAVRNLAKALKVDLASVTPTGLQGQITAEDVRNYATKATTFSKENLKMEKLHGVRRAMAQTLAHSHQEVVPVSLFDDADITYLTDDLTVTLIQAIVAAIQDQPALNAWYDGKTLERHIHQDIHLGLAIDTEEGLFVPVLNAVQSESSTALRNRINDFKLRVKDRTISPNELQGATITLSNFGMFAGRYATPVVVVPQVAILGCGRAREEARSIGGELTTRRMLPLSLTFDHRAVTGGEATRFLGAVMQFLESRHFFENA